MDISLRAKNLRLSEGLKEYTRQKLDEVLERFLSNESQPLGAGVELIKLTRHHKKGNIFRVEVNLSLHGHKIISQANAENIYKAIDLVKQKLEKEIVRHRGKEATINRRIGRSIKKFLSISPLARFRVRKPKKYV